MCLFFIRCGKMRILQKIDKISPESWLKMELHSWLSKSQQAEKRVKSCYRFRANFSKIFIPPLKKLFIENHWAQYFSRNAFLLSKIELEITEIFLLTENTNLIFQRTKAVIFIILFRRLWYTGSRIHDRNQIVKNHPPLGLSIRSLDQFDLFLWDSHWYKSDSLKLCSRVK